MTWMTLELLAPLTTLLLLLIWVLTRNKDAAKRSRLPPSPKGVPVLGHLPLMRNGSPGAKCAEWAEECGPVFRIKVGVVDVVVLNDFESIKKFLCKKEGLYRPENMVFSNVGVNGVATLNGQAWVDNRRISMRILRDLGFGKKRMEDLVKEEARRLVEKLVRTNGSPVPTLRHFTPSAANLISRVLFGERDAFSSPRGRAMVENLDKFSKALGAGSLIEVLPEWAKPLVMLFPFARSVAIRRFVQNLIELGRQYVTDHEITEDYPGNEDFVGAYIEKMNELKNHHDSNLNRNYLIGNTVSLYMAVSHSVPSFVHWHMLNCAQSVDTVQARLHDEIDRVVGRDRPPTWEDHNAMPYTMAVIWEMYRCKPNSTLPRSVGEDILLNGYLIPKGCIVMPNFWAVLMSSSLWESPNQFDPTRFLTKDGYTLLDKPEQLISFSLGRRMCPGEPLATVEIFLYLTTLLQAFAVLPEEGRPFSIDFKNASMDDFVDQKLRFVKR